MNLSSKNKLNIGIFYLFELKDLCIVIFRTKTASIIGEAKVLLHGCIHQLVPRIIYFEVHTKKYKTVKKPMVIEIIPIVTPSLLVKLNFSSNSTKI